MDKNKTEAILDKLLETTKQNKVEWKKSSSKDVFMAVLGVAQAYVSSSLGDYRLVFYNEKNDIVGDFRGTNYYFKIKELYELAKIKALKINESLDDIDDFLSKIK